MIVLGWDSATFDVIEPLEAQERLPCFAGLRDKGVATGLRSTWPPMTDCAWTSAFTGRNPGAHGIFGSWYRAPGEYACRYFSSRDRRAAALWELTEGVTHLVWNVPMAYPPSEIDGVMVAGYGAPAGSRFCQPDSFQDDLTARWGLDDLLDRAPRGSLESFRADIVRGLEVQAEALVWSAREVDPDCVIAVWPHIDRAQHFFWSFRGSDGPLAGVVDSVYEAADRATAAVIEAFPDANVLVVSDHGAGPLLGDVNLGPHLVARDWARYGGGRSSAMARVAWAMPHRVRRVAKGLAPGLARRAVRAGLSAQLGDFDWSETKAFVGIHGDLWLNLEGREATSTVTRGEAVGLLEEIRHDLLAVTDPATGSPVFGAIHQRDDIYSGAAVDLAPDLMLDSWSRGYRVSPSRGRGDPLVARPRPLMGVSEAWSADHRPRGVLAAAGPDIARSEVGDLDLYDVAPAVLALLAHRIPEGLDGSVPEQLLSGAFLASHPLTYGEEAQARATGGEFTEDEAAAVAAHLKDLGYIE